MGDAATAERAAHSLKGVAGTLGATTLVGDRRQGRNRDQDRAGHRCRTHLAVRRSLGAAVQAIRTALPEEIPANGAGGASRDPRTVVKPLTQLKRLLETDDGEAADFIDRCQDPIYPAC